MFDLTKSFKTDSAETGLPGTRVSSKEAQQDAVAHKGKTGEAIVAGLAYSSTATAGKDAGVKPIIYGLRDRIE